MTYGWIALLSDYGRRDGFVAACHGVIARIAPQARIIDVTHDVPRFDIRHGAVVLAQTVPYLPPSVIVAVVDPGVGTKRRGVAIGAGGSVLVGPDNGLLSWAVAALGGAAEAVVLEAPAYRLVPPHGGSRTFDGRDVFAPAAAHLAAGTTLSALGPAARDLVQLPTPRTQIHSGTVDTEVLTVDGFGNVQLAATEEHARTSGFTDRVRLAGHRGAVDLPVARAFGDVPIGRPAVYVDSAGHLAIAINQGDAAAQLGLHARDRVRLSVTPATGQPDPAASNLS